MYDDQGQPFKQNLSASFPSRWGFEGDKGELARLQRTALNGSIFHNISTLDCLRRYTAMFGDRSSLIMVSSNTDSPDSSVLSYGLQAARGAHASEPGFWMCQNSNTFSCKRLAAHGFQTEKETKLAIAEWNMLGSKIDYCLTSYQPTEGKCSVVYSYTIMISERPSTRL